MAGNGALAEEPHKTFDTILVLDFGSVIPTRASILHRVDKILTSA